VKMQIWRMAMSYAVETRTERASTRFTASRRVLRSYRITPSKSLITAESMTSKMYCRIEQLSFVLSKEERKEKGTWPPI
jgi:hypothetical protein